MQAWACLWVKAMEKRFKSDRALRRAVTTTVSGLARQEPQGSGELGAKVGLADHWKLAHRAVLGQDIGRIAGGEQDLDAVIQPPRLARELDAVDAAGHHHVAEQDIRPHPALEHPQ